MQSEVADAVERVYHQYVYNASEQKPDRNADKCGHGEVAEYVKLQLTPFKPETSQHRKVLLFVLDDISGDADDRKNDDDKDDDCEHGHKHARVKILDGAALVHY